jgi:hypothetical protein
VPAPPARAFCFARSRCLLARQISMHSAHCRKPAFAGRGQVFFEHSGIAAGRQTGGRKQAARGNKRDQGT